MCVCHEQIFDNNNICKRNKNDRKHFRTCKNSLALIFDQFIRLIFSSFFFIWQVKDNGQEICWVSLGQLIRKDRWFIITLYYITKKETEKEIEYIMVVCFTLTLFLYVNRIRNWFRHFVNTDWHLCACVYSFSIIFFSRVINDERNVYVYIYLPNELTWNTLSHSTILTYIK